MLFAAKPFIQARDGDNVRVAFDASQHLEVVRFHKETLDNGWQKGRAGDIQLMAVIPTYIMGWLNKFHPGWMEQATHKWDGSRLQKWLDEDDFGKACKVAQDNPNRRNFIIK